MSKEQTTQPKSRQKKKFKPFIPIAVIGCILVIALVLYIAYSKHMKYEPEVYESYNIADMDAEGRPYSDYSTVYYTTDISPEGLMKVYDALGVTPEGNVAVKLSTGEAGNPNHLDPNLIKDLVHRVDGTIIECNTAYGGSKRMETAMHMQVAKEHGFTDIADVDIMDADGYMTIPVEGGEYLQENWVGKNLQNYDYVLVLTHFKGHPMGGFGGSLKNISIGIASQEGKVRIHSGGLLKKPTITFASLITNQNVFIGSMAEAAKSVSDYYDHGERMCYINVMNHMSVDCDCVSAPAEVDMHDIGIFASLNPVALDQACVDQVFSAPDGASLQNRMMTLNGIYILRHAEEIGFGNRAYELVSLDE